MGCGCICGPRCRYPVSHLYDLSRALNHHNKRSNEPSKIRSIRYTCNTCHGLTARQFQTRSLAFIEDSDLTLVTSCLPGSSTTGCPRHCLHGLVNHGLSRICTVIVMTASHNPGPSCSKGCYRKRWGCEIGRGGEQSLFAAVDPSALAAAHAQANRITTWDTELHIEERFLIGPQLVPGLQCSTCESGPGPPS